MGGDGVAGASSAIDGHRAGCRAIVQIAGPALTIDIELLRQLARQSYGVHALLSAHEEVILAQSQQNAACNGAHEVHERFARWLLLARDRIGQDDFFLTQEFVAEMLGVQRTSVTRVAQKLTRCRHNTLSPRPHSYPQPCTAQGRRPASAMEPYWRDLLDCSDLGPIGNR